MMTLSFRNTFRKYRPSWCAQRAIAGSLSVLLCLGSQCLVTQVVAQTFDSTSDGTDGALNLTTAGTVLFDPVALGLDPDSDNIFHFTTINIGPGVTVRLPETHLNGPVFWLASGAAQIDGIIDLNGEDGAEPDLLTFNARPPSVPGAGGFGGGTGGTESTQDQPGFGPGGAVADGGRGGGAGYVTMQQGNIYGSAFLVPLVGGSGGSGADYGGTPGREGAFGGAGGGALLIASSVSISVDGTIQANGGGGGDGSWFGGGGGSGGSIRLVAPAIQGIGTLNVRAGPGGAGIDGFRSGQLGSIGRGRMEAFQHDFSGSVAGSWTTGTPFELFLPTTPAPSVRVVSITDAGGTKVVPARPTGSFTLPDITIDDIGLVDVAIEAQNVPVGTVVQLHILSESEALQIVDSPPLEGTRDLSTTIISTTIPLGFSSGFVRAVWRP